MQQNAVHLLMQSHFAFLCHVILAFHQNLDLFCDLLESAEHLLVSVCEVVDSVWDVGLLAEFLDKCLCLSQVVSRDSGEQVVYSLELQSTVDEVQPSGAVDIHGSSQLPLGERLGLTNV